MSQIKTIYIDDIQGFSPMVDKEGNDRVKKITAKFISKGESLIEENGGEIFNEPGDSHYAVFDNFQKALKAAIEVQQYYKVRTHLNRKKINVRIVLFQGVASEIKNNYFGSGIIKASRAESFGKASCVTVNNDFVKSIREDWGSAKTKKYFKSVGKHKFKGITKKEELYEFDWNNYAINNPDISLAKRVYDCLELADIVLSNLDCSKLSCPGKLIWPVVPRKVVTVIHRGQIEIILLLAILGWDIHLLIADCGVKLTRKEIESFIKQVLNHAELRGIRGLKVSRLSKYFDVKYPKAGDVLSRFQKIVSTMSVERLSDINTKKYSGVIKTEIMQDPTLEFLRPILTCAVVVHLLIGNKGIVIAGADERSQWDYIINNIYEFGAILNPIFKQLQPGKKSHTARQTPKWPFWNDKQSLVDDTNGTNAAKWVFHMFAQLESFPSQYVLLNGKRISSKSWKNEFKCPSNIDLNDLVNFVWPILKP